MKRILTIALLLYALSGSSQQILGTGASMIVIKDPTWQASDATRTATEKADRMALYAQTSTIVTNAREHLQWVKDATKKLKDINRRIANYRYLEESIVAVSNAYNRVQRALSTINDHNCFRPEEYRMINQSLMSLVGQTTFAIQSLTVVLTDNFSEMNDAERLASLSTALKQLREDLSVVDAFLNELEILDNQRLQIRTVNALNQIFIK